jgi:hypothetical protein
VHIIFMTRLNLGEEGPGLQMDIFLEGRRTGQDYPAQKLGVGEHGSVLMYNSPGVTRHHSIWVAGFSGLRRYGRHVLSKGQRHPMRTPSYSTYSRRWEVRLGEGGGAIVLCNTCVECEVGESVAQSGALRKNYTLSNH